MEYNAFVAVLVMTEFKNKNKNKRKRPDFTAWLKEAMKKSGFQKKFCTKSCFMEKGTMRNRKDLPCKRVMILNAAHLPGAYDYIIEFLCPDISTLELFVNECLRGASDVSEIVKDTFTYVGVPIGKSKLSIGQRKVGEITDRKSSAD